MKLKEKFYNIAIRQVCFIRQIIEQSSNLENVT